MCGIAGICTSHPGSTEELAARLERMSCRLVHRGPDEKGEFIAPTVALGSRRLRIIDLTTGRMPISNESGSVQVVYNGEIYNYRGLRESLRSRGHTLKTMTDTEVLAHLYEDQGAELVHQLRGMFAFAIWDTETETLTLALDRLGIKPLYYRVDDGALSFASELKALVADASAAPEIDVGALVEYLALGYIRAPRTIYQGYRKLPPASLLQFHKAALRVWPYWQFPRIQDVGPRSEEEAVDELERLLREAVVDRLVADVPVGAFLSGGVDSSVVVALAAQEASGPLKTFTVGFEGNNELDYARRVAEIYDTDHYELVLGSASCKIAEELLDYFDEPFGDSSAVPTYFVSELAREHVTVAVSGDGGDELFAGYDQYAHDARWAWVDTVPQGIRSLLFGMPTKVLPFGAYGWNLMRALAATREERFNLYRVQELDPELGGLLRSDLNARFAWSDGLFAREFLDAAALPFAARLLYVDAVTYLPGDILTKVDRMSMAHSLEARVPILDHRVVEYAASLPVEWKLRGGERKWIFKRLARKHLPDDVLDRPKRGFSLPIGDWLRNELADRLDVLVSAESQSTRFLHRPAVRRLVAEHRRGRRDHNDVLWRLLMLEGWLRRNEGLDLGQLVEAAPTLSDR
jgi:asparagine synthase (glutamine-hydrolysing)